MNLKVTAATLLLWAKTMFGDVAMDKRERALRFLEEACELAQAADLTEIDCYRIASRTWSRPKDTVHKEAGGLLVTLLAFCSVHDLDPEDVLFDEMRRILAKPNEHWRAKHDAKVAAGTTTASVSFAKLTFNRCSTCPDFGSCAQANACLLESR